MNETQKFTPESFWSEFSDAELMSEDLLHIEKPLKLIQKIVISGSIDVYFRRSITPQLFITGFSKEAMDTVKTEIKGDRLNIQNEGISIIHSAGRSVRMVNTGRNSIQIGSVGGNVTMINTGDNAIQIGQIGGSVNVNGNVFVSGRKISIGDVIVTNENIITGGVLAVGVALPEIPIIEISGSGDVELLDVKQDNIQFEIMGSGDITASGEVINVDASISGSGDINIRNLIAKNSAFQIAGSGDIRAHVTQEFQATILGSGDILVHGNPPRRNSEILGSGTVKFKK